MSVLLSGQGGVCSCLQFRTIFDVLVFVFVFVFSCRWRWRWWWWWRGQWWVYSRVQVRTSEQFSALTSWHDSPSWPWTCTRVLRSAFSFGSNHDIAVRLRNVDRLFILKVWVFESLLRCFPKKTFTFTQNEDISWRLLSQNVDQIKIKINKLIPPGAEHFVRLIQKNAVFDKNPWAIMLELKVLKKEVPLFKLLTSSVS